MTDKPGWKFCAMRSRYKLSIVLDGTYIEVEHLSTLSCYEDTVTEATGLTRERIVQETKRCARKLGQKLKQIGFSSADFMRSSNDTWEEN